ncbi:Exostosin domain-containing protein [Quillaja saponaria]|uniref:Exostosin domain-containing protein n=1 Tax=Quillaja saponaria TaxID=32244 RepID=A0AAD7PH74_QUISA|nr:Exostosin domain-containing protein [Quillaja saponaria]
MLLPQKIKTKHHLSRPLYQPQQFPIMLRAVLAVALTVALSSWFTILLRTSTSDTLGLEFDLSESSHSTGRLQILANQTSKSDNHSSSYSNFSNSDALLWIKTEEAPFSHIDHGPYHDCGLFIAEFEIMMQNLKIYVYPDALMNGSRSSPFSPIFLPHPDPFHPRIGNYFSEHMFKVALFQSSLITPYPEEAHLFFLPFSINLLRNDPLVHSEVSISEFVAQYTAKISRNYKFWNASAGSDHFYVLCHSIGREAASMFHDLHNNAIQVSCSSSYFQRYYVAHKDVGLPQVWPRPPDKAVSPPDARHRLVYFAGRVQNSRIRQALVVQWGNDTDMDIFSTSPSFSYEEGFRRSKYCLHIRGYEVNTARISDAIHFGCIPVIISNYYDLPFANVLNWSKFSVIIRHEEIAFLKKRLLSITRLVYLNMYHNLKQVRRHFVWHRKPKGYDAFHMTAYQLWLRRKHKLFY